MIGDDLQPRPSSPGGPLVLPRVRVLGAEVSACSFLQAQDCLADMVERREGGYVSCANAYSVTLAQRDADLHRVLQGAALCTADGMSVVWALRLLGHAAERVHNDDLFLACCARFGGWRHFLLGGREGQADEVAAAMLQRFPGIAVVGTFATPRRPVPAQDTDAIRALIRETRPSIVWVGMGTPAQDHWMAGATSLGVPLVGVGSLFDLLSGRTRAAPEWVKRHGLQWLFRLSQEPRRLAGRYAIHNTQFVLGLARQLWLDKTRR